MGNINPYENGLEMTIPYREFHTGKKYMNIPSKKYIYV